MNCIIIDDEDEDGTESSDSTEDHEKTVTCKDYMLHFISFFWKFLFAFVPPTSKTVLFKKKNMNKKILNLILLKVYVVDGFVFVYQFRSLAF